MQLAPEVASQAVVFKGVVLLSSFSSVGRRVIKFPQKRLHGRLLLMGTRVIHPLPKNG